MQMGFSYSWGTTADDILYTNLSTAAPVFPLNTQTLYIPGGRDGNVAVISVSVKTAVIPLSPIFRVPVVPNPVPLIVRAEPPNAEKMKKVYHTLVKHRSHIKSNIGQTLSLT